jgi:hypothetical protein
MHGRADHTAANLQTGQLAQLAEAFPQIDQLENGQCRWPVGTNANNEHVFCAEPVAYSRTNRSACASYCSVHAAIAFTRVPGSVLVPRAVKSQPGWLFTVAVNFRFACQAHNYLQILHLMMLIHSPKGEITVCNATGCDEPAVAKGMCLKHYMRPKDERRAIALKVMAQA